MIHDVYDDEEEEEDDDKGVLRIINTPNSFGGAAVWWSRLGHCKWHPHQDNPLQRKHFPSPQPPQAAVPCTLR